MTIRPLPHSFLQFAMAVVCLLIAGLALPLAANVQPAPVADAVRTAIQNQLSDNSHLHFYAWKERKNHGHDTQVERQIQTPDGIVSRVILINDKPLTPAQQKAEDERINKMLDPAQMRRSQKAQQEDDANTRKLLQAIPDAFDFSPVDTKTGSNGHKITTVQFTPRAGFIPPSRETVVLTAMNGDVILDETAHRLVKIDGTLFKDVLFGWGFFGRLYKGGRFVVEQGEITPTHWDTTHMLLHFEGKILLFKSLHIDDNETDWDYHPVPPMTAKQAIDFLNQSEPPQNAGAAITPGSSPRGPSAALPAPL